MEFNSNFEVLEVKTTVVEHIDYGLIMMNIPHMWSKTKGEGVGVVVIDTGIDAGHPDLSPNIKAAYDFTGSPNHGNDIAGHGTHVAGIIAGIDNGVGIIGVAPRCNIYSLKALGDNGSGTYQSIMAALDWVLANHKAHNIKLVNMSLGSPGPFPGDMDILRRLKEEGIIVIVAAGNDGHTAASPNESTVDYPAKYAAQGLCISVGAIDNQKHLAQFSSNGLGEVTVVGPGVEVLSCYPVSQYARLSGTSMATPAICGLITLMVASGKVNNLDQAIEELKKMSGDIGPSDKFGFGLPRA